MGEVVNLRRQRKRAAREREAAEAAGNRVLHGRSKAEREVEAARRDLDERRLEAHRLEDPRQE